MFVGRAPYGYRYELDAGGRRVRFVPGDSEEIDIVRFIFDGYLNRDLSLEAIVAELNARQVRSPSGCKRWGKTTVHNILTNPAYVGDYVWGKVPQGRYYRCSSGQVTPAGRGPHKAERQPPGKWLVIRDSHEPLVDRAFFEQVQARLAANRIRTSPSRKRGTYSLSQLLVCSHCGSPMYGTRRRSGGRTETVYRCGRNMTDGSCAARVVCERTLLEQLAEALQAELLEPRNRQRLRAALRRQHEQEGGQAERAAAGLRRRLAQLDRDIAKAKGNLALLDPDFIPGVQAQVRDWERDREAAQAELDRTIRQSPAHTIDDILRNVEWLVEVVRSSDPAAVRPAMRAAIGRVDLRFDTVPKAKVTRYPLAGGTIHLRECADLSCSGPAAAR
jgi:hypothetical protein